MIKNLEKYEKVLEKFISIKNKEFTKGPTYETDNNNTYIKSKIKEYGDWATYFHNKKLPKVKTQHK